ncbi:MAG: hypothetical protein HUK17_02795 [Bacteroidales bacterium]|nr:hypothetical protein [Bacteroidales bacterium]
MKLVDPDGEEFIGALIGACVGAATEIISQTIANGVENCSKGESFFKGWNENIDWLDVGVSAATGMLDGLVPGAGHLSSKAITATKVAATVIGDGIKACVDYKDGKVLVVGRDKDPRGCLVDFGANLASSAMTAGIYGDIAKGSYSNAWGKVATSWVFHATASSMSSSFQKLLPNKDKKLNPHVEIGPLSRCILPDDYGCYE